MYVRSDGMLASYCPDFMVKMGGELFVVETKAQKELKDANVKQKQGRARGTIRRAAFCYPAGY
jgi:type III restriction enzyme